MNNIVELRNAPNKIEEDLKEHFPRPSEIRAVFMFSMAKCGSTMLTNAAKYCLEKSAIPSFHFPRYFWEKGVLKNTWSKYDLRNFLRDGVVYYGFRSLPKFLSASELLKERKCIFLVRDPRDVATSHYFSKLYEHPVPGKGKGPAAKKFLEERRRLEETSLDEHVIQYSQSFLRTWRGYIEHLPNDETILRTYRYEDIIFSKKTFLSDAFSFLNLDIADSVITAAAEKADIFPESEQTHKRIRVVTPGNHRLKLRSETIEKLNSILYDPLTHHGYI